MGEDEAKFGSMCNLFFASMSQAKKQLEQLEHFFSSRLYPGFVKESETAMAEIRAAHQEVQKKWLQERQGLLQERQMWMQEKQGLIQARASAERLLMQEKQKEREEKQALLQQLELMRLQYGSLLQHKGNADHLVHKALENVEKLKQEQQQEQQQLKQLQQMEGRFGQELPENYKQHHYQQQTQQLKDLQNLSTQDWHQRNAGLLGNSLPQELGASSGGFSDHRPMPNLGKENPLDEQDELGLFHQRMIGGAYPGYDLSGAVGCGTGRMFWDRTGGSILTGSSGGMMNLSKYDDPVWWKQSESDKEGGNRFGGLAFDGVHGFIGQDSRGGHIPPARVLHSRLKVARAFGRI